MNVNQSARCDSQQPVHTASWTVPRKEGIRFLFTPVLRVVEWVALIRFLFGV